jgi:glycosyltransferase involved in cell wall biosynthesis
VSILRVAWDNCLAGQDKAGTGVYARCLLEQFGKREDLRMEILPGWRRSSAPGGVFIRTFGSAANLLWTHAVLPGILSKIKADVLHAPAFISPAGCPCPVVITVHDITYLLYPSHFSRWWVTYLKTVMPRAVKSASAIICPSEHAKRDIMKTYTVPAAKVHAVPHGVHRDRFHPGVALDRDWALSLGLRDGYLLHVGTFSYRKNIPVLLHAIAHLRSRGKWANRQLVLAGSQNLSLRGAEEIFRTIQALDLSGSVVLTEHVPSQHIPGLYAHASMLVMPSFYEGFGFPVLEAMAVGTPVVCSEASSLPEVAGDAARFFPPHDQYALADAIEELLENRCLAEELRRKGLKQAEGFTWQQAAEKTVAIYRAVARS